MPDFDDALTLIGPKPDGSLGAARLAEDNALLVTLAGDYVDPVLGCLNVRITQPPPLKQYSPDDLNVKARSIDSASTSLWVDVAGCSKITAYVRVTAGTLPGSGGQRVELLGSPYAGT